MQLQFDKSNIACLQSVLDQVQNQEQTQELRLPEDMPDVGNVLAAWGQCIIRSKEWRGGGVSLTGGVMVWILYEPEDGGEPRTLDTWIPYQMKWSFPNTEHDGVMQIVCMPRFVDVRSVSARKLMIRVGLSAHAEAFCAAKMEMYTPTELPEDIELLKNTYPLCLPMEAGEKPFAVEEDLTLPASCPKIVKLVRYSLRPEVIDKKVMAGKVVFRGMTVLHILYQSDDGKLHSWDFEIPFSQFTELERDYEQDAALKIIPALTGLELELGEDDVLHLKAGITGQYVVYDRVMTEIVEDAYSPKRAVTLQKMQQQLPILLEMQADTMRAEASVEMDAAVVADVAFYPEYPQMMTQGEAIAADLSGEFQALCYDDLGALSGCRSRWEGSWNLPADLDSRACVQTSVSGNPQAAMGEGNVQMRSDIALDAQIYGRRGLEMVTGLEVGQQEQPDENRPSVIVRRAGDDTLWQIAKQTGTTVAAIRQANDLQEEPVNGQMLLIPIP